MNRRRLPFALLVATLLLMVAIGGAVLWMQRRAPPPGPLAGTAIGGSFAMVDQNNRAVTQASFAGRYPVYYFGYTYCPDVCPLDMAKIAKGLMLFEKSDPERAANVQPVFVSVDPARDTPAVLKTFVAAFHPRLLGLTGSAAQVDAMKRNFRVYAQRAGTGPDYLVDHSTVSYLFGPDGRPISFFDRDATPQSIAAMLETYVR